MALSNIKSQVQALSEEEQSALDGLLEANGLSREDLFSGTQQLHLEMFLHDWPKMLCLHLFPALKTLCLIHQDIKEIGGLDECSNLERLWIVENDVRVIKGLSRLSKLRDLYLNSNRIVKMEGLQQLTNIEVLWLCDNHISAITDLSGLSRLRELNLARNDISVIGDALMGNTALEVLNLADNAIGSFKEVRPLTRLPYLTDLCFADPMWGDCPISALCNYQTYVLFMLPKLSSLDTLLLADETKQLAEATFLKKQMYYNMRIKTMHRNARNIIKLATEGKRVRSQHQRPLMARLVQQQKELQRELGEASAYGTDSLAPDGKPRPSGETAEALQAKLGKIQTLLDAHSHEVGGTEAQFEECASRTYQVVDAHVGRMLLELETAGNIRLEEGRPADLWYTSCVDLLMSRFNSNDYDVQLGVTGINILGVTRIHNRWLRNRFEKQLAGCVDTQDGSYKKSMEYLFLGEHPALPGNMDGIVEAGLLPIATVAGLGLDAAVVLSNSVMLADQLRLQAILESRAQAARNSTSAAQDQVGRADNPAIGRLMIVKAYLGRTTADNCGLTTNRLGGGSAKLFSADGQLVMSSCLEGPRVERRLYGGGSGTVDAVYRCKPGDSKQRIWYMFDPMLVLPEYLVEFQYTLSPTSAKLCPAVSSLGLMGAALSQDTMQAIVNGLDPELRPLARPLMDWLAFHFDSSLLQQLDSQGEGEARVNAILDAAPQLVPRAKLYTMTMEMLNRHLQGLPLDGLTYLNLHNCALRKLEGLTLCRGLKTLVLSFNDITRIEGLSEMTGLTHLDIAHNLVRKVDGLKGLVSLQHLDMSYNQVVKLEEIYGLKKYVGQLTYLDLSGNLLCEDKSYRPTMLRKMTNLAVFDGRKISQADAAMFGGDNAGALTMAMVLEHGSSGHRFAVADASLTSKGLSVGLQPAHIQELVVERRHIRRLQNLSSLVNLRRASFADNQISHIEGLEACTALEELCLEDNRIGSIEGLTGLTRLKKLQLGKNRLGALEMLGCVTNLTQLSVEDNELSSLAGLEPLVCLMELYAGNNRIHELREVQRLRELPKIIILDLSGNPCTASAADNYRLYVIFNVRKLKVLDGTPIDAAEQAAAKSKYSGRLTLEFLEEKLGHRMFDRIRDLDVSGIKVRDVGGVFLRDELESLQELNLDGNMLVEVSGLALLRQLVVLKLNSNRLGEECTFNPRRMLDKNQELYKAWSNPARQQRVTGGGQATSSMQIDLFPCIQAIQLGSNQIASISSLQLGCLTSLRTLFLNNNDITRIDGLEGLSNLQELILDRNRIRYIDPEAFAGLGRLRELRLEDNGLRSLANLQHLTLLQSLHLSSNRISEPLELDRLSGLTTLVEVTLINNPITRKQGYRALLICKCPKLYTADGQVITFEEREYSDNMFGNTQMSAHVVGADGIGLGLAGKQGQAVRLTNLDFASLAAAASQFGQVPVGMGPSIPSSMMMLGAGGLGLEGMSLRDAGGAGGMQKDGGMNAVTASIAAGGQDQGYRDVWGRPTSTDRRGQGVGGAPAAPRGVGAARLGPDAGSPGSLTLSPGPAGQRGTGGASASPARRQALQMGRPQGGYRGAY